MLIRTFLIVLVLALAPAISAPAAAEELDMVNRPVNSSGMTGLINTSIPFTLPRGSVEIGLSAMSETSAVPEFTITEHPVSVTFGLLENLEMGLRGSYLYREEGQDTARTRGSGDSELAIKWNFLPQNENTLYPAMALIMNGRGLTGDRDAGMNRVLNWGASAGLNIGREILWGEHLFGVYADGRIVVEDLNKQDMRDRYSIVNAGILLPISKAHNLQIILEYSSTSGKRYADLVDGGDSSMVTYGLRMVTERYNLTVGNQLIRKDIAGSDASGRVIGTISIRI